MSNPDLPRLYFDYAMAHQRVLTAPVGRRAAAEQEREQRWSEYVANGGVLPPLAGHSAAPSEFEALRQGASGPRVSDLQKLLGMPTLAQDGKFGSTTRRWVEDFQARHNLAVTGWVDPVTWALAQDTGARPAAEHVTPPSRDAATGSPLQFEVRNRNYSVMLALDAIEQRTYCNTFNLALLALLVYSENPKAKKPDGKPDERAPMDKLLAPLNEIGSFEFQPVAIVDKQTNKETSSWRPLLRVTEPGHRYRGVELSSAGQPGTTTPDPDGGNEEVTFIDTQGRMWISDAHVIVAMRGTLELPEDVITDVAAAKDRWPYGPGHVCRGFWLGFAAIREQLDDEMKLLRPHLPVFVTGHSLGGALATLVALYVRTKYPSHPVVLYTYAQPRCVDNQLASTHWDDPMLTYYRFESPVDPVPMVPSHRTAHDLVNLLGDLPDMLAPRTKESIFWQAVTTGLSGRPVDALLQYWASSEVNAFKQVIDRYRRLLAQLSLDQCQGSALSFAELAQVLAPPDMDSRHFGVRCQFARRGGRPVIVQAEDRAIETLAEVNQDNLDLLIRHTIDEAKDAIKGDLGAAYMETMTGMPAPEGMRKDKLQLRIDPLAHSMYNYIAHVLFEFGQHPAYVRGVKDTSLPLSGAPLERMEVFYFHSHYFSRNRFWGDRPEHKDVKVQDGEVSLW